MTIDDFKGPNAHLLAYPILNRTPVEMLLFEQGLLPADMIALDLQETGAPQTFVGGKGAAIPPLSAYAQLIP